jgi:hypothetical protein
MSSKENVRENEQNEEKLNLRCKDNNLSEFKSTKAKKPFKAPINYNKKEKQIRKHTGQTFAERRKKYKELKELRQSLRELREDRKEEVKIFIKVNF